MAAPSPIILNVGTVNSTNSYLAEIADDMPHGAVVAAREQTAGRGQRGNSWEAAPGLNATFSMLLRPEGVSPAEQFVISQAVALAVACTLDPLLAPVGLAAEVKWPNDIYVGNRKIAGILIENSLTGLTIDRTIAGIGININQRQWLSDAPNPVSLLELTGAETDVDTVVASVATRVLRALESLDREALHARYMARLWRGHGNWQWHDVVEGDIFTGSITAVKPTGHLVITDTAGRPRRFAFKEVAPL